jgi:lipopolysaccharide biosynthesis regulator YciM
LSRAYQLALFAVGANPHNAEFRDTLGIILMKMNQYQEAVVEFQIALADNVVDAASVHEKLAICYEKLGHKMLSERHAAQSKPAEKEQLTSG